MIGNCEVLYSQYLAAGNNEYESKAVVMCAVKDKLVTTLSNFKNGSATQEKLNSDYASLLYSYNDFKQATGL